MKQLITILIFLLSPGLCLAQTPLEYVLSHRDKVQGSDRLSLDSAILKRLVRQDRLEEARSFIQSVGPQTQPQLIVYGAVLLDDQGRPEDAFRWVSESLPTGPFQDPMGVRTVFLMNSKTAGQAESRLALLREKKALAPLDLTVTVATFAGRPEALAVFSEELSTQAPSLDPLPLIKVYTTVASFGLPEAGGWAERVQARVDELGFENWSEMYFALPRRQASMVELLEERLIQHVQQEQNLPVTLNLFFQAQQASLPLEARLIPQLDAMARDAPLDRLDSFSQVPDLILYLGLRGEDEFAQKLIADIEQLIEQGLQEAETRGEDPERLATARQGKTELVTQMNVSLGAGMWCAGRKERGVALATAACGSEALPRMAEQTAGKLDCYYEIARFAPDEDVQAWTTAAATQMSQQIDVTYWMERIRQLSPESRGEAVTAVVGFPGLPDNIREELASLSPETMERAEGEAELKALETLSPETDGWTLVLLSILSLEELDLAPSLQARLEAYCRKHL